MSLKQFPRFVSDRRLTDFGRQFRGRFLHFFLLRELIRCLDLRRYLPIFPEVGQNVPRLSMHQNVLVFWIFQILTSNVTGEDRLNNI